MTVVLGGLREPLALMTKCIGIGAFPGELMAEHPSATPSGLDPCDGLDPGNVGSTTPAYRVTVDSPPDGLRILTPDGTGFPALYDPAGTALTDLPPVLLGDAVTLRESSNLVVIAPVQGSYDALCETMRAAAAEPGVEVIDLAGKTALQQPPSLTLWIEQPDLMLQLLIVGDIDHDDLQAAAAALNITPAD